MKRIILMENFKTGQPQEFLYHHFFVFSYHVPLDPLILSGDFPNQLQFNVSLRLALSRVSRAKPGCSDQG